jgi:hypothetical protein
MVLRVFASLFLLVAVPFMVTTSSVQAGGPPVSCAPPPAPCAPPPCAPPSCASSGTPFGPLGDCMGICQGLVGACLNLPAAIMGGILAPPRCGTPSCAPPSCVPACAPACPPPSCAPAYAPPYGQGYRPRMYAPMPPQPCGITKCKPLAYVPGNAAEASENEATTALASMPSSNTVSGEATSPSADLPLVLCSAMVETPFRLASGSLIKAGSSRSGGHLFAGSSGPSAPPIFGGHW